jgi:hypothetical protein
VLAHFSLELLLQLLHPALSAMGALFVFGAKQPLSSQLFA